MPLAVRFDGYGGIDVLRVEEVERPVPGAGEVLVRVRAAGINPGEAAIRSGALHEVFPATFPSGQGADLAGTVEEAGPGVDAFAVGDDVVGFTERRASHAEYVVVEAGDLVRRPAGVSWEEAGALFVAGTTAWAALAAVDLEEGETVLVSGAAGGVGSLVVQLARIAGATVVGVAGEANHGWLADHGVLPVAYGDGLEGRIRSSSGGRIDACVDTFGGGYVDMALELGVPAARIDTIIDFEAAGRHPGVRTAGNADAADAATLGRLLSLMDDGRLEVPIAATYPLTQVRAAFGELERRHTRGKIVLVP